MATQTKTTSLVPEAVTTLQPAAQVPAAEYWSQYLRSIMEPMLETVGTYSAAEQATHLRFLREHVAPALGPLPAEPHAQYTMTYVGTPFEPSLNLSSSGRPKVRYEFEVVVPHGRAGPDPFGEGLARELVPGLAEAVGGDTKWLRSLMDALYLTPDEADAVRDRLPSFIPCTLMAFDLDGPRTMMKAYIPAVRKAVATGRSSKDVILGAVRGLEPLGSELGPGLDMIDEYLANCQHDATLIFVGIDCVDPTTHKGARVKLYLHTSSNAFDVVQDVMTLGGRLDDETSRERVELLRSIWPLLRDEAEAGGAAADEAWSKPDRVPGTPFSGLQYNIELSPGKARPETKCYVPTFQYARNADAAEANLESVLKKLGHGWGHSGKYRDTIRTVFGQERIYGPGFASFSYTKEKGAYMSSYIAKPLQQEGAEIKPLGFEYF